MNHNTEYASKKSAQHGAQQAYDTSASDAACGTISQQNDEAPTAFGAPAANPLSPDTRSGTTKFVEPTWRQHADAKVVGLKHYGLAERIYEQRRQQLTRSSNSRKSCAGSGGGSRFNGDRFSIEEMEEKARLKEVTNPLKLTYLGNLAALKVMLYYMITFETILSCTFTAALTLYWYFSYKDSSDWQGGGMDFVLLAFALTAPLSAALTMAFQRRERALAVIAEFRSWSYHLYLSHSLWDWSTDGGRAKADIDWLEHCDAVLAHLIGVGDELARFLSLPTTSRSRHRMTKQGRKEAARTIEVAYHLLESMATQRLTRLVLYSERLKMLGLPSGEMSRVRQFERFLSSSIEQLRMIKMYRSPQAFRSFARIFTLVLPPFYAPTFAQVAKEVNSIGVGVAFGIITALGLTALFESLQVLEDPFTAFVTLDGIDVKEEFEVLHFAQLNQTRALIFPGAPQYPAGRRAALTSKSKSPAHVGSPPAQCHHHVAVDQTGHQVGANKNDLNFGAPFTFGDLEVEDEELGMPIAAETSLFRETAFLDEDENPVPLQGVSTNPMFRSRRHRSSPEPRAIQL